MENLENGPWVTVQEFHKQVSLVKQLAEENARLRETVTRLNRRCQAAESAARGVLDDAKARGLSLSRGMAVWAYADLKRRVLEAIGEKGI